MRVLLMEFQVFHDYNRLARRGQVPPLTCSHCGSEYTVRLGPGNEPILQCFMCLTLTKPGLDLYDYLVDKVKEHFGG